MTRVGMPQPPAQCGPQVMQDTTGRDGEKASFQATTEEVEDQVDETVEGEQPHCCEVPLQCTAEPAAQGDRSGKTELVKRRRVIDPPAAGDHDQHRQRIEPMGQA
ncbi:hypothetical protein D3C84_1086590 [compost metagenome]